MVILHTKPKIPWWIGDICDMVAETGAQSEYFSPKPGLPLPGGKN